MKKPFIALALLLTFFLIAGEAPAKVYIDLSAPAVKKLLIAVEDVKDMGSSGTDADVIKTIKAELSSALKSDLRFSDLFTAIDNQAFLDDTSKWTPGEPVDFKPWRAIGADTLVKGAFRAEKERLTVEVRFFDCVRGTEVLAKRYMGSSANPRRLAHYFSDHLYEELTGRKGIFTTKLLFVSDKSGSKEIYMSDYDGRNTRQITRNRSINLSPQWSPDGKKMLYTSYKRGEPHLYMLDFVTGADTLLSEKPGINISGRFSPDGERAALTLSSEKSPELYIIDLKTKEYRRLTDNHWIDVSPAWSPDGKKIAFVSDMSGNPHIFMLDLETGGVSRLTYGGKYNSSPVWSPDGRL
ncbi:MAG: PD40 domain-containing protein, partial [Deltaproteobacteria bacterium]|nr:PD40 domain-containing protein [Deltaproteobacteria bacterium]